MSKVIIEIETDNAAFEGFGKEGEIARILRDLAQRFEMSDIAKGLHPVRISDINGNAIGEVTIEEKL